MGVSKKERKSLFPWTGTSRIGLSAMPSFCPLGPSGRMGGDIFWTVPATKRHSGGAGAELWIIRGRIWITSTNKDYSVSGIVSILSLANIFQLEESTMAGLKYWVWASSGWLGRWVRDIDEFDGWCRSGLASGNDRIRRGWLTPECHNNNKCLALSSGQSDQYTV